VRLDDTLVIEHDGQDGNRLGSRAGEIEKHAAVRVAALSNELAGERVCVVTKSIERILADDRAFLHPQPFRALADPLAWSDFALGVVIIAGKMLAEIEPCGGLVLLRHGGEHGADDSQTCRLPCAVRSAALGC
jgi:hypothetical protein